MFITAESLLIALAQQLIESCCYIPHWLHRLTATKCEGSYQHHLSGYEKLVKNFFYMTEKKLEQL